MNATTIDIATLAQLNVASQPVKRRRAVTIALWTLQILLGLLFLFAGANKLGGQADQVAGFARIGIGQWFRYFTGVLEVAGGLGLMIPRLAGLAALGLAGIMLVAIFMHLFLLPPAGLAVIPASVGTLLGLVAWVRRPAARALLGRLAG